MRWIATAYYRTDAGLIDVEYRLDELSSLDTLIENGPDWNTIDRIEVRLAKPSTLTVEATIAK